MQPILFEGFAEDCTITGRLTMFGERLSDFLNGQERFHIHHVVCNSLADGHEAAIDSLSVERSELLCVVATGPRGNEKQRVSLQTACRPRSGLTSSSAGCTRRPARTSWRRSSGASR